MPPDADKLRQRHGPSVDSSYAPTTHPIHVTETTRNNNITLSQLKSTEICIDGIVYDLQNFVHPGGDNILMFGGNDVTVAYKMIHPYHTEKHLQKLQVVGTVTDFQCE
jgi:fatty acid desaturase (delta-4 desaturase)